MVQSPKISDADTQDSVLETPAGDYDGYRGAYGIEDTRMVLIEAKRDDIHLFCITFDKEVRDYLLHM